MLVYGDPQFRVTLGAFVSSLADMLQALQQPSQSEPGARRFDTTATRLVIAAGQCEQGIEDDSSGQFPPSVRAAVRQVTEAAADLYLTGPAPGSAPLAPALSACGSALQGLAAELPDALLTVKVPEGYAFYKLTLQQYVLAARAWLADHHSAESRGSVAVIGLRSIGTSLSAVVASALRREARFGHVRRVTLRPHGHPFQRSVSLPDGFAADYALVVDEGPGLSGSSMAAVYTALIASGLSAERIALLPGHGNLPGGQGSEEVNRIWSTARRYVSAADGAIWSSEDCEAWLDIGSGSWRRHAYPPDAQNAWPAAAPRFERPKYLCCRSGTQPAAVWSFAGLSEVLDSDGALRSRDIAAARRINALAQAGWTTPAAVAAAGFVATEWIAGERLQAGDAERDPGIVPKLARYCAAASLHPLDESVSAESWLRLREMLICNAREHLGSAAAAAASRLAQAAQAEFASDNTRAPAYGDGRLAPQEWVRHAGGGILKTDCAGHEYDHTIVGRQPVWWDLAGASVEWGFDELQRERLWREAQIALGWSAASQIAPGSATGRAYRAAYAAFRIGLLAFGGWPDNRAGDSPDEQAERKRRERAVLHYSRTLAEVLEVDKL